MRPIWPVALLALFGLSGCRSGQTDRATATSPTATVNRGREDVEALAIGMLAPTRGPRQALGEEAQAAAAMALAEANAAPDGPRLALRVRPDDGPWGTQARETAALVYEQGCCVIVGGLDGRVTHIVAQVAAKAQVPVMTPWASEDTITQAGVSWVYRCLPNDRQQISALLSAASAHGQTAVLVEDSFDGRMARFTLDRLAEEPGHSFVTVAQVPSTEAERERVADRITESGARAVILLGGGEGVAAMLPLLREQEPRLELFASLATCSPLLLAAAGEAVGDLRVPWPAEVASDDLADFARRYQQRCGGKPTPLAAFTYDAVSLVAQAVREAGPSREELQRFFAAVDRRGITGRLRFDESGNRIGEIIVVRPPLLADSVPMQHT